MRTEPSATLPWIESSRPTHLGKPSANRIRRDGGAPDGLGTRSGIVAALDRPCTEYGYPRCQGRRASCIRVHGESIGKDIRHTIQVYKFGHVLLPRCNAISSRSLPIAPSIRNTRKQSAIALTATAKMRQNLLLLAALALAYAMAAPAPLSHHLVTDDTSEHVPHDTDWYDNASQDFFIHPSCNATETVQLRKALADAVKLADHAKQHILRYGNSSAHYRKYFGNALLGEVIGYLDKVVNRDRTTSLFCCDNPDGNCVLPGK